MSSLNQIESAGRQSGVLTSLQLDNTGALKVTSTTTIANGPGVYNNIKIASINIVNTNVEILPSLFNGSGNTGSITLLRVILVIESGSGPSQTLYLRTNQTGGGAGSSVSTVTSNVTGIPIKSFVTNELDLLDFNVIVPLGGSASIASRFNSVGLGGTGSQTITSLFGTTDITVCFIYNQN
jgi:hypothetical protein